MKVKILAVADFDPAHVLAGHREALLAHCPDIDYRIAVHHLFANGPAPDFWLHGPGGCDFDRLLPFAEECDILQFHPAIGQPWSYTTTDPHLGPDADTLAFGPIQWDDMVRFPLAARIAYFHGSKNAAANARAYAGRYRARGMALWASTLDYVDWMEAKYIPPILPALWNIAPAPLRTDDEPLIVAHAPTDPSNCHTETFLDICGKWGITSRYLRRRPHAEVLAAKATCNAGFDHLRGCFSVNTLENCALGLVPFVGTKMGYAELFREEMNGEGLPFAEIDGATALELEMRAYDEDPAMTRRTQTEAREWFRRVFEPERLALRLRDAYLEVLGR